MTKLAALTPDVMCNMLLDGCTDRAIAEHFAVSKGAIHNWIRRQPDEVQALIAAARTESAESWLDKTEQSSRELQEAIQAGDLEAPQMAALVALHRVNAQENARRAAIRNSKYRDNRQVEHTGQIEINPQLATNRLRELFGVAAIEGEAERVEND